MSSSDSTAPAGRGRPPAADAGGMATVARAAAHAGVLAGLVLLGGAMRAAEEGSVPLWPEGVPGLRSDATPERIADGRASNVHWPYFTVFPAPPDRAAGTAVILCPGGGYEWLAIVNQGSLMAARLNAMGITACVLHYRLKEYGHPAPLRDVLRAIRIVRSRAEAYGVKPDRIGLLGTSAGGHLAACAATMYDDAEGRTGSALDAVSARPNFVALLFPVITMREPFAHAGSRAALLGGDSPPALIDRLSAERSVCQSTPPVFIVHTQEDQTVPVENSLLFFQALRDAGVPAELHIWPHGGHGFGTRPGEAGPPATWADRLEEWLRAGGWLAP